MFNDLKGFAQFISVERGLMVLMISVGASFLMGEALVWFDAVFLGVIAFCIWSAADAMNNIFDVDLDVLSDPFRAEFTKKLGKLGLFVAMFFTALSLILGAFTMTPYVVLFIAVGIMFGVLYSVPPFRLRKTAYKPIVNFTVGAVPVLIVAAFFNVFSINIVALVLLIGVTTAVNSLWEDLADYASDFTSGSRTIPIILGFKRGLIFTIIMGYTLIPLMVLVGALFQLGWTYYLTLAALSAFVSLRVYQKRTLLKEGDTKQLFKLGEVLAKDFVIIAIAFTLSLMLSSLLKIVPTLF
ncbi:UbiA prenyltransferase family protein [Candidatus Bathyarchaeota archaeon]|nr:UbiA prenyltransferase family protein [Candidatus Bathyarchaeota archaeon]